MFDRFLRRGDEARYRRINERVGISKDGPAPSEEPLSAASVLRALRAMSELDWVRLAAVEEAESADPDDIKNGERIYRDAYATARRRGVFDELGQALSAVRQAATEVAKAAAGEEALAAYRRFEAVSSGRGVLADPADAPAVGRYLGFKDAATNAVSAAALRPYISRQDFAYLWRGYATVLDFTSKAATLAPSTDGFPRAGAPATAIGPVTGGTLRPPDIPAAVQTPASAEHADPDRLHLGPNGGEVAALLARLAASGPRAWEVLLAAHADAYRPDHEARARRISLLVTRAERQGIATGAIKAEDGPAATREAEEAAAKVVPLIITAAQTRSAEEPEIVARTVAEFARSAANTVAALLVVRPFLEPGEFEELWAPYARVLGYPGVGMALDIPRDYRFVPELLRRGGKRVETTFVTVGEQPLTDKVDLFRLGERWAAVSLGHQLIAEGPSRDWVVADIADMLAERVRQRLAAGELVVGFYRPDGTPVIDAEKWFQEGLRAKQRRQ